MKTLDEIRVWVKSLGTASEGVFGGFTGGWMLQQHVEEYAQFLHLLQDYSVKRIFEIGSAEGGNIRTLHAFCQPEVIALCENNSHGGFLYRPENLQGVPRIEFIGNSDEPWLVKAVSLLMPEADLVFCDGAHFDPWVMKDFLNFGPLVRVGGLYVLHDSQNEQAVKDLCLHIGACYRDRWELVGRFHHGVGLTIYERVG